MFPRWADDAGAAALFRRTATVANTEPSSRGMRYLLLRQIHLAQQRRVQPRHLLAPGRGDARRSALLTMRASFLRWADDGRTLALSVAAHSRPNLGPMKN